MDGDLRKKAGFEATKAHYEEAKSADSMVGKLGWSSSLVQEKNLDCLLRDIPLENTSLLDIGCGHADALSFIKKKKRVRTLDYIGIDFVEELLAQAKKNHPKENFQLLNFMDYHPDQAIDWALISGTLAVFEKDYPEFWKDCLEKAFSLVNKGLLFNILSKESLKESLAKQLDQRHYYADPQEVLDFCQRLSPFYRIQNDCDTGHITVQLFKENQAEDYRVEDEEQNDSMRKLTEARYKELIQAYEETTDRRDFTAIAAASYAYYKEGHADLGRRSLEEGLSVFMTDSDPKKRAQIRDEKHEHFYLYLSILEMMVNDNESPEASVDTFLSYLKDHPIEQYLKGLLVLRDEDWKAAIAYFEEARTAYPHFIDLHTLLGQCYEALDESENAVDCFEASLDLDPNQYSLIVPYLQCCIDSDQVERGWEQLRKWPQKELREKALLFLEENRK